MARSSKQQAAANRENVVQVASSLFRTQGIRGTSVPEIMEAASLTHGAFYGQFASKDSLVGEATDAAFVALEKRLDQLRHHARDSMTTLDALADDYLTPAHRDNPGDGCPVAALVGEVAQEPMGSTLRDHFGRDFEAVVRHIVGNGTEADRQRVLANYALLVGSLLLARSTSGLPISEEILAAGKAGLRP